MAAGAPDDPKLRSDPMLHRVLDDVARTGSEMERRRSDALLAKDRLFALVEDGENESRRLIAYLTGPGLGNIDLADAAPIGSMLDAIGTCDNLDLMLNSPGGSGETAEKLVEMCRDHCKREFRVIVPNYAKSAGTLISLGADRVLMGYLSELGPIDPQIPISVAGVQQMVSGQSVIQAYEATQEKVKEVSEAGESALGYLQSLNASTMEPAFIEHCRRGVEFSRDIAKKFLPRYQLKAKYKGKKGFTKKKLEGLAEEVAENLLSKDARFSHGRLIGGEEARDDVGLNIEYLERDDERWEAYWELYLRAEVYMQTVPAAQEGAIVTKLFFDRNSTLPALGMS
jgi:Serine dehydrogenase proteinase